MSKWTSLIAIGCIAPACLANGLNVALTPRFEENAGQAASHIRFLVRAPGYAAAFAREGVVFQAATAGAGETGPVEMRLAGSAPQASVGGEGRPLASTMRYGGAFGSRGTRLNNYAAIRYRAVYPGIDWVWHFREGAVEFQFELSPGADPGAIQLAFSGTSQVRLDAEGSLEVDGGVALHYRRPEAWQESGGVRVAVPVAFRVGGGTVTLEVGRYDPRLPLTIDPVVRYSRYLGGAGYDAANAVATDAAGNLYVTGETSSVDFSSSKGIRSNRDAFVSKISADGTQVLYTVMLSSAGNDTGKAIALDASGNVWVAGVAGGPGFPVTTGALYAHAAGVEDVFVARLDGTGRLTYSTYFGGSGTDVATALALDPAGNVYIAGYTSSVNFPTTAGAPQTAYAGGIDAFLAKLASSGTVLSYATLLGGSGNDMANGLAVDAAGNACIAGRTESSNLPVRNAVQPAYSGNGDVLLACLNAAGTSWSTLTYLGGSGSDEANGIARDSAGAIYVTGDTYSSNFPTTAGAYRSASAGSYDAFAVKLNAAGTVVVFATLLGGSASDSATAIAVDSGGRAWVAGYTASADFPVSGTPPFGGYFDGFLANLSADGSSLLSSGYLGGSGDDRCLGLALTPAGEPVVAGLTGSTNMSITTGSAPAPYNAFVARMSVAVPEVPPAAVSVSATTNGGSTTFTAVLSDGNGYSDISTVYFLVDRVLGGVNACFIVYTRGANQLFLLNDAGTAWLPPMAPGASGALSNSQCTLNGAGTSVTGTGTTLSVQFNLTFSSTFSGVKNLYLAGYDASNAGSGWIQFGTFGIGGNLAPTVVSVVQGSGTGGSSTFTVSAQDGDGYLDIQTAHLLIDRALNGVNACFLMYNRGTNSLYLMNDADTAWLAPVTPGSSSTVSNSQCTLFAAGSSVSGTGNTLTVKFNVLAQPGFSSLKYIYAEAFDLANAGAGWQSMGTATVNANIAPQAVSAVPTSIGSDSALLTVTAQDANGYADIQTVYLLIDRALNGVNACFLVYIRSTNSIYLMNDSGSAWLPPVVPGSAATVANSQCMLTAASSSVSGAGSALSVAFSLRFQPGFAGAKYLYLSALDSSIAGSGWQTAGSWMVP